jgi:NAD(P)-dependent dehydrogenase (short-subunit alcohol dehydrogenase family)
MPKRKQAILITGAAKRIGATLARHLASAGYDLVLHYSRSKADAEKLAKELRGRGTAVTLVKADLTDTKSLVRFWQKLPACSGLIHNASAFKRDTLASMTHASLREHMAVHLEAPLLLAQGFLKQLPKNTSGAIILLGDGTFGWSVAPQFFSYAASKYALTSVIDILAAAAAPKARANIIALGPTLRGAGDTKEIFAMLAEKSPLKRTGEPREVCAAVDYLLAAPGVTGQVISLANGFQLTSFRRGFPDTNA